MLFVMTDVEKRRLKLLRDTRKNYSETSVTPAIHPRFQSAYLSLYKRDEDISRPDGNSFFLRSIIAVLLFALVFLMDYQGQTFGSIDSQMIICEISNNLLGQ